MNEIDALIKLWTWTQIHRGTHSAETCAEILLGLYNGERFPFNLNHLRRLDSAHLEAAMVLIEADARPLREVHTQLDVMTGRHDFGERFEHLAHQYNLKGRCKKSSLEPLEPELLAIRQPQTGKAA